MFNRLSGISVRTPSSKKRSIPNRNVVDPAPKSPRPIQPRLPESFLNGVSILCSIVNERPIPPLTPVPESFLSGVKIQCPPVKPPPVAVPLPPEPKLFKCDECDSEFGSVNLLSRHKSRQHGRGNFKCTFCQKMYFNFAGFFLHEKRHKERRELAGMRLAEVSEHPGGSGDIDNARSGVAMLKCGLCDLKTFAKQMDLVEHVAKDHNRPDVDAQVRIFVSKAEFEKWKRDVEEKGKFKFLLTKTRINMTNKRITYACHRSGVHNSISTGKRLPRQRGSIKMGFHCTAFAQVFVDTKTDCVNVKYCLAHYGHGDRPVKLKRQIRSTKTLNESDIQIGASEEIVQYHNYGKEAKDGLNLIEDRSSCENNTTGNCGDISGNCARDNIRNHEDNIWNHVGYDECNEEVAEAQTEFVAQIEDLRRIVATIRDADDLRHLTGKIIKAKNLAELLASTASIMFPSQQEAPSTPRSSRSGKQSRSPSKGGKRSSPRSQSGKHSSPRKR